MTKGKISGKTVRREQITERIIRTEANRTTGHQGRKVKKVAQEMKERREESQGKGTRKDRGRIALKKGVRVQERDGKGREES